MKYKREKVWKRREEGLHEKRGGERHSTGKKPGEKKGTSIFQKKE